MQQAVESTDAPPLGKSPLDPQFEVDASAAAAANATASRKRQCKPRRQRLRRRASLLV